MMVGKREKKDGSGCPSFESVGAYFDNELDPSSADYAHIAECAECRKRLEDYRGIADSLISELDAAVPAGLVGGIKLELKREELRGKSGSVLPFKPLLRVAALVAVSSFAAFLLFRGNVAEHASHASPPAVAVADTPSSPLVFLGDAKPSPEKSAASASRKHEAETLDEGGLDYGSLTPVDSSGTKTDPRPAVGENKPAATTEPIAGEVKHTWSISDSNRAEKAFRRLAKGLGIAVFKDSDPYGNTILSCRTTKKNLVELTRRFHDEGFKLLSPAQPQPERTVFPGKASDSVSYQALLARPR